MREPARTQRSCSGITPHRRGRKSDPQPRQGAAGERTPAAPPHPGPRGCPSPASAQPAPVPASTRCEAPHLERSSGHRESAGISSPSPPFNRLEPSPPPASPARPAQCHYLQRESSPGRVGSPATGAVPSSGSLRRGETPRRPRSLRRQPRRGRLANPQRRSGAHPPRDAAGGGRREARRGRNRPGVPSRPLVRLQRYRLRGTSPPCPAPAASSPGRASPSTAPRVPLRSIQPPSPTRRSFVKPTTPLGWVGGFWFWLLFFFLSLPPPFPLSLSLAALLLRLPSSLPWSLPPLQPEPFPGRRCSALPIAAAAVRSLFPRPARCAALRLPLRSRGRAALSRCPSRGSGLLPRRREPSRTEAWVLQLRSSVKEGASEEQGPPAALPGERGSASHSGRRAGGGGILQRHLNAEIRYQLSLKSPPEV